MVDWLDDDEMRAWRGLVEVVAEVHASLEAELVEGFDISEGDYGVLVNLSEAPDHRLRMCDLALRLHLSPSGLTRRLDGLVRQGLVARALGPVDGPLALRRARPDPVVSELRSVGVRDARGRRAGARRRRAPTLHREPQPYADPPDRYRLRRGAPSACVGRGGRDRLSVPLRHPHRLAPWAGPMGWALR